MGKRKKMPLEDFERAVVAKGLVSAIAERGGKMLRHGTTGMQLTSLEFEYRGNVFSITGESTGDVLAKVNNILNQPEDKEENHERQSKSDTGAAGGAAEDGEEA